MRNDLPTGLGENRLSRYTYSVEHSQITSLNQHHNTAKETLHCSQITTQKLTTDITTCPGPTPVTEPVHGFAFQTDFSLSSRPRPENFFSGWENQNKVCLHFSRPRRPSSAGWWRHMLQIQTLAGGIQRASNCIIRFVNCLLLPEAKKVSHSTLFIKRMSISSIPMVSDIVRLFVHKIWAGGYVWNRSM